MTDVAADWVLNGAPSPRRRPLKPKPPTTCQVLAIANENRLPPTVWFEGKTDILICRGERNTFVAECTFWDGPAMLTKAIDQLRGCASWRGTKTAILLFNRGRELSKVLAQVGPTVVRRVVG